MITNGQFEAPPTNRKGFQFVQARGVAIMDTSGSPSGDIGLVAIIPVGIASVSFASLKHTHTCIHTWLIKGMCTQIHISAGGHTHRCTHTRLTRTDT